MTRRNQLGQALVGGLAFARYTIGHFLNQPDNPTAFALLRFEAMDEPQVDDVHRHLFYELIWVDAGQSQQVIDYQRYPVGAGSLFFISPGQVHEFEEWEPLRGGSILFTADFFLLNHPDQDKLFELSFLDNFYANPLLHPADADFRAIRQTIALLDTEYQRPDRADAVLQPLLHSLLAQIQRCVDQQPGAGRVSRQYVVQYKQFRQLIDQHFATARSVSNYADQLNLTPHHLNLICRQVTGQTAGGVIRTRVVLEAKRLLTFTDLPVSAIAAQLGYVDPSYFARLFPSTNRLVAPGFPVVRIRNRHVRKVPAIVGFVLPGWGGCRYLCGVHFYHTRTTIMAQQLWFITGISSGLGKAMAETFLAAGHFVIGTFRKPEQVTAFNEQHKEAGFSYQLDLTNPDQIQAVAQSVTDRFGRIDVLVNNAGFGFAGAIEEASDAELRAVFETNFFGTVALTKAFLPLFRQQRSGHIIQLSSHSGMKAPAGFGVYSASKFALEGISEALAAELAPLGIKLTIVEPGPFRTDFAGAGFGQAENHIADYDATAGAFRNRMVQVNGQQEGDPQKAAEAILHITTIENPPLRLPLGKIAVGTLGAKIASVQQDVDTWRSVAEGATF